jgi:hypothetical protein
MPSLRGGAWLRPCGLVRPARAGHRELFCGLRRVRSVLLLPTRQWRSTLHYVDFVARYQDRSYPKLLYSRFG